MKLNGILYPVFMLLQKVEFLEKGFKSASLRNIVKAVGLTTGAFYGYYKSKEELFDALVGEPTKSLWINSRKHRKHSPT